MAKNLRTWATLACIALTGCGIPTFYDLFPLDAVLLMPSSTITDTPADVGYDYDQQTVPVADGRSIVVWYVYSKQSKGVILLVPGMDRNKSRYVAPLPVFIESGYDVILMDYEGFGNSPGQETLANMVDDAFAAAEYAFTRHETVIGHGVSIGTPILARVASEIDFAACVFQGSVIFEQEAELWLRERGIESAALWIFANMYIMPQLPEDYDILKYMPMVKGPKLITHSVEDEVNPFAGGQIVFEVATEPKTFWEMRGNHGQMVEIEPELYKNKIMGWLDQTLGFDAIGAD